ncbi:MAG: hypothetical protein IKK33_15740 [Lachnospiraceae bacterium]|nr:hypothetical protein [Lachnospiraceae bacterium]
MGNCLEKNTYTELIECIENSDINATKARSLGVIILRRLEKYYRHILELNSMEPFSELLMLRSYIEENIDNLDADVLNRYIALCNETGGAVVGEADETELLTEEEILLISEKYYEEIQEAEGECRISYEYAYCIMGALYYLINYFWLIEDSIKERLRNLLSCLFEEYLVDFSEELADLTNEDFIELTIDLLIDEING